MAPNHNGRLDTLNGAQGNLNFGNIDAKTANLDLKILAANVNQATIRFANAAESPVKYIRALLPVGSGKKTALVRSGSRQYPREIYRLFTAS